MLKIIGNKKEFAVEFEFTDKGDFHNAKSRIWIGNQYVGDYENESPIYNVFHYLNFLVSNPNQFLTREFVGMNKEDVYKIMIPYETKDDYFKLTDEIKNRLSEYDRFIGVFNEAYYEFIIRIYIEDNQICFLWKINPNEYSISENNYQGYNRSIHFHKVPLTIVKAVIEEFKKELIKEGVLN